MDIIKELFNCDLLFFIGDEGENFKKILNYLEAGPKERKRILDDMQLEQLKGTGIGYGMPPEDKNNKK